MIGQTKKKNSAPESGGSSSLGKWPESATEKIRKRCLEFGNIRDVWLCAVINRAGAVTGCAYLEPETFDALHPITIRALRGYLVKYFPLADIPVFFIILESLPKYPDGSLNLDAFPLPDLPSCAESSPPRNQTQRMIAAFFHEIMPHLRGRPLGIHENFFSLGGTVSSLFQLSEGIYRCFHLRMEPSELFCIPTIREMANELEKRKHKT